MFVQKHSIENHQTMFEYPYLGVGSPPPLIRIPPPQLKAYKPFYGSQRTFEKMILEQENKKYIESLYKLQYPFLSIETKINFSSPIPIPLPIPLFQKEDEEDEDEEDEEEKDEKEKEQEKEQDEDDYNYDNDYDYDDDDDNYGKSKPLKLQKFNDDNVIEITGLTIKQICEFSLKKLKEKLGFKTKAYVFAVKKIRRRYNNHKSYNRMIKKKLNNQKIHEKVNIQQIIDNKKSLFKFRKYTEEDIFKKTGLSIEQIIDMSIEELRDLFDFGSDEYKFALYIRQRWSLTKSTIISKYS